MYDATLGRFLERDTPGRSGYDYVRDNPANWLEPYRRAGQAPPVVIVQDWRDHTGSKSYTVQVGPCCRKLEVRYRYRARYVEVNGASVMQWTDLAFTKFLVGEKVPCTGKEIGELASLKGPWTRWTSPFAKSGEAAAEPPPMNPLGETSHGVDGETAAASYAPHMLGD
jgi:hypothetical protein